MNNNVRNIKKIVKGRPAVDGAGVNLIRVFGHRDTKDFDPFLLLDAFDSTNLEDYTAGFPWHPHRGIETITYLVEGEIEHGDSLMPQAAQRMLGLQIWLNLPAKDKMATPKYNGITKEEVPVVNEPGVEVRVLAGHYKDVKGATQGDNVKATYLDVTMEAGASWHLETDPGQTLFIYAFYGEAIFGKDEQPTASRQAVLFDYAQTFSAKAPKTATRFVLLMGSPLKEPIAWGGPIVMNSKEALNEAFQELEKGTFIKEAGVKA